MVLKDELSESEKAEAYKNEVFEVVSLILSLEYDLSLLMNEDNDIRKKVFEVFSQMPDAIINPENKEYDKHKGFDLQGELNDLLREYYNNI